VRLSTEKGADFEDRDGFAGRATSTSMQGVRFGFRFMQGPATTARSSSKPSIAEGKLTVYPHVDRE